MAATHVVVDGSNIATEGRATPSLKQLDEAVRDFLKEYPHDICTVVVDATFEHRIDSSERRLYDEGMTAGELITPPAGTIGRGDKFLLQIADRAGATVFSNDSFQEFHGEYGWLFDEGRLMGGKPVPEVGWIFTPRTPVRGPRSRVATQAAKRRTASATGAPPAGPSVEEAPAKRTAKKTSKRAAKKTPRTLVEKAAPAATSALPEPPAGRTGEDQPGSARRSGRRRASPVAPEPVNDPLPFIEFIADRGPGARVQGEVLEFSSHGAYVAVGDVRCYLALKHMSDPPPRRAREVLSRGEVREFVVQRLDAPRRGIDLAVPGFEQIEAPVPEPPTTRTRATEGDAVAPEPATAEALSRDRPAAEKAPATTGAPQPESEATLPKRPARQAATHKKKATTKATGARKTPLRKAPSKKATVKKTPAKKAATKASGATAAKATPTRKTATKKAPTTAAKKAPARKTTAKGTSTVKATAKKAATTAKRTVKKATRKTAAKKA